MYKLWPMIRHGIVMNRWDVQGMSNKHAACAVHSRHAYIVVPLIDANKIIFPLITGEICTYCILSFPVRTLLLALASLFHSEGVVIVQLPSSPHCSYPIAVH